MSREFEKWVKMSSLIYRCIIFVTVMWAMVAHIPNLDTFIALLIIILGIGFILEPYIDSIKYLLEEEDGTD